MPPRSFYLLAHEGRVCVAGKDTRQILPQHLTSPSTLVRAASIARIGHDVQGRVSIIQKAAGSTLSLPA